MKKNRILNYLLIGVLFMLYGCLTYSVTVVHTEGTATDIVDEDQTQSPSTSVKASASLPAIP